MSREAKLEKLEAAGILERRHFSEEELKMIDHITDEEIEVLIKLRKKIGGSPDDKPHIRPNIGL
jgi:hypothetical protein